MENAQDKVNANSGQGLEIEVVIAQNFTTFASDADVVGIGENADCSLIPNKMYSYNLADSLTDAETDWNPADVMAAFDGFSSVQENYRPATGGGSGLSDTGSPLETAPLSSAAGNAATANIAWSESSAQLSVADAPAELVITVDKEEVLNGGSESAGFVAEAESITLLNDGHAVVDLKAQSITIRNSSVNTLIGTIVTDIVDFSGAVEGRIANVAIIAKTRITFNDKQIIEDSKLSSGQIINNSGLTFKGINTIVSPLTMSGVGALIWDIRSTVAYVNDYSVLNADMATLVAIQVEKNQNVGIYVLGDNAASAKYFTMIGTSLSGQEAVLRVGGDILEDTVYHRTYQLILESQYTDRLYLVISATADDGLVFYNTAWEKGQEVSVYFRGETYSGTVGDTSSENRFFNIYEDAKLSAGTMASIVTVQSEESLARYQSFDGRNVVMAAEATYDGHVFMGTMNIEGTWAHWEGDYSVEIDSGDYRGVVIGGDAGNITVLRNGNIYLTINGGTFAQQVAGGMSFTSDKSSGAMLHDGNVYFTIKGGVFKARVYGGDFCFVSSVSPTTTSGDINLVVDSSQNRIEFGEDITVGSRETGVIYGSTKVTFTGLGKNLNFKKVGALVNGGCSADCYCSRDHREMESYVRDRRTLEFNEFTGDFGASPEMFTNVSFVGDSVVNFTAAKVDFRYVQTWEFEYRSSASGITLNDFREDTLIFNVEDMTEESQWKVLSAVNTDAFYGIWDAGAVYINGEKANLGRERYTTGSFELSLSEDKLSMVISKLA